MILDLSSLEFVQDYEIVRAIAGHRARRSGLAHMPDWREP